MAEKENTSRAQTSIVADGGIEADWSQTYSKCGSRLWHQEQTRYT